MPLRTNSKAATVAILKRGSLRHRGVESNRGGWLLGALLLLLIAAVAIGASIQ